MEKKRKTVLSAFVFAAALTAAIAVWYFSPKIFLDGVDPADVKSVTVFDGSTGNGFTVNQPEQIRHIVQNIQEREMERDHISLGYSGYRFRMSFCDQKGTEIERFIVNSDDTIRSDPFFYRCGGGLCVDYLEELESEN